MHRKQIRCIRLPWSEYSHPNPELDPELAGLTRSTRPPPYPLGIRINEFAVSGHELESCGRRAGKEVDGGATPQLTFLFSPNLQPPRADASSSGSPPPPPPTPSSPKRNPDGHRASSVSPVTFRDYATNDATSVTPTKATGVPTDLSLPRAPASPELSPLAVLDGMRKRVEQKNVYFLSGTNLIVGTLKVSAQSCGIYTTVVKILVRVLEFSLSQIGQSSTFGNISTERAYRSSHFTLLFNAQLLSAAAC